VKTAYVEQSRDSLEGDKTIWEVISGGQEIMQLGKRSVNSRAYCAQFGFTGADQSKKVGVLSGGERNRVLLARVLKSEANLLLLDEPTNDLDVNSIRALEEALETFAGCAVIISHDRWFLDRTATHIMAFEGDSYVHWFAGNYSAYLEDFKKRKGQGRGPAAPHQIPQADSLEAEEPAHLAAVAFGRAALAAFAGQQVLEAGLLGALVFGGGREVGHEFRQLLRSDARARVGDDLEGAGHGADPDGDRLAGMDVAAGLGLEFADEHLAGAARGRGLGAGLEDPHAPEPFVEAGIIHRGINQHKTGDSGKQEPIGHSVS
jgi:energy-coupling factor transporter ATP-binding protein EcfA2